MVKRAELSLTGWPDSIVRALLLIQKHPQVRRIGTPVKSEGGAMEIDVDFEVSLPQDWRVVGSSPNGVRHVETVRFHFPSIYPLDAPLLSLRPDFDRSHPHVLPRLLDNRVLPCIAEISLADLLHKEGLRGILNQTALWLDNAAFGTLMNREQGWEPARRDELPHSITADVEALRRRTTKHGGHFYFPFRYALLELLSGDFGARGFLEDDSVRFNFNTISNYLNVRTVEGVTIGQSLALFVWPGKKSDGSLFVCGKYRPEDVRNFSDLLHRAVDYGCEDTLLERIRWLRHCAITSRPNPELVFAIILCARRPIHLIGTTSDIELCSYVARFKDIVRDDWETGAVEYAAQYEKIGPNLCRRLSGVAATTGAWTLLGAGSLGSKIALHLTRQGMAPSHVIDSGLIRAHNAVRHGLIPEPSHVQAIWTGYKAKLLCKSIESFGQQSEAVCKDAVHTLRDSKDRRRLVSDITTLVVNSAASIRMREFLAALPPGEMAARVAETSLFADGRLGLITIEGPARSPNTEDLTAEFYRLVGADPKLQPMLFAVEAGLERVRIGEGCGSPTMVMSDALLSTHAAGMAQIISRDLLVPVAERRAGVWVSQLGKDDISIAWTFHAPPSIRIITPSTSRKWKVHLPEAIEAAMQAEINRWPGVETGGILIGRLSEISRTFHVVDLLPAPPDSQRSPALFELGVEGVRPALQTYSERHAWSLYCLGTWHSHLGASTPSGLDKLTARSVALARVAPSLLLIKAPGSYSALVADAGL
jgi:hypothetical protein